MENNENITVNKKALDDVLTTSLKVIEKLFLENKKLKEDLQKFTNGSDESEKTLQEFMHKVRAYGVPESRGIENEQH